MAQAYAFKDRPVALTLKGMALERQLEGRGLDVDKTREFDPRLMGRRNGWVELLENLAAATLDANSYVIPGTARAQVMYLSGDPASLRPQETLYSDGVKHELKRTVYNDSLTASYVTGTRLFVLEDTRGILWLLPGQASQVAIGKLKADCPPDSVGTLTQQIDDGNGQMQDAADVVGFNLHPVTWPTDYLMKAVPTAGWPLPLLEPYEYKLCPEPTP